MPLEIAFWDVGQGDCSTIHSPDGTLIVIDTGPKGSPLVDWLKDRRYRIDTLVITHNDSDHAGSLPALVADVPIRRICMLRDRDFKDAKFERLFRIVETESKKGRFIVERLERPLEIWQDSSLAAHLNVLAPSMIEAEVGGEPNQISGILCLHLAGQPAVVWPGDSSIARLSENCSGLNPTWLFGPHHGAPAGARNKAQARVLLNPVQPKSSFLSLGSRNKYSHPSLRYIARLGEIGCKVACSQMTWICDRTRVSEGRPLLASHLMLGLRPPRNGVSCRGAMKLFWDGANLQEDQLMEEHRGRVGTLRRAQCLRAQLLATRVTEPST